MSGRWTDMGGGGDSSQDFTQATQEESALEFDEHTQVEPAAEPGAEGTEDPARPVEPVPWGRLVRLSGGSAISLMPRPEQPQGRALNEVTLGRGKVCEVQVADQRISTKHCRIYCEALSGHLGGMEIYVEDMSANGTWINHDIKLVRGHRRLLHSGDEIALLNPYKHLKKGPTRTPGKDGEDAAKLEADAATFTFINLNRNRGMSHGRAGSLSVAETLRAGTVPGVSSPVLRSSASGVAGIFGGARKVEDLYDVREMIGHGTSGEVRRAINRTTGKQVAVKVIETRKFALTPGLTPKELVQEAEMLKRVDHEYIIKLEDIFQTEQAVYLVMDLVSGGDLFDRIVEKGVYAEDLAQELLFRVLTAVEYLHSQDIVHRDLKPENILLVGKDNDVDVKITDFGLAKRANKEGLKTFCGTPQYFAPEVLKRRNTVLGVGRYGKEADMWSVGVILYILLSGTHPFHTTTLFDQITHASFSMTGAEWEHVSDAAKDLVSKLLTKSPKTRLTADQALAHPFITQRAAAVASAALAAGLATNAAEEPTGADDGRAVRATGAGAVGRSSSQDTDISSTSGAEETSTPEEAAPALKSLSPTEGGGASATAVPPGPASSPKDSSSTPRSVVPELPPPQPREPTKGAACGDRAGGGRGRKRTKKDSAGDKPSPSYSQLEMHVVRVGASDQGATGAGDAQEIAAGTGARDSNGVHVAMSPPVAPAPGDSGRVGADAQANGNARSRGAPPRHGRGGSSTQGTGPPIPPLHSDTETGMGGKRKAGGAHAPQCTVVAAALAMTKPSSRLSTGRGRVAAADTSAEDDDIMEYSSDDSPAKGNRARPGRGREREGTARAQPTRAAARGKGVSAGSTAPPPSEPERSRQLHLKLGDSGKLHLSKLGPMSRPGAGSRVDRANGDRAAQAMAGGAAATVEDSVGGGAPADSGGIGKGGKKLKGGNKPQRTMTHLWKSSDNAGSTRK